MKAPHVDGLIHACQSYPEVKNAVNLKQLTSLFEMMCFVEKQGDDDFRSIWITAERGKIDEFGDFEEYFECGEVANEEEFVELWHYYYPEEVKWYSFAIAKYADVFYFYIDSKLTLQFKADEAGSEPENDFHSELIEWLLKITGETISMIRENVQMYIDFVNLSLPHKKRTGRILRSDYWSVFPDEKKEFEIINTPEILTVLQKIRIQSESESLNYLPEISSGDFYRFCEIGYDANQYFHHSQKTLTSKEKYIAKADGRDCGLRMLDENSYHDFERWYKTEKNCGGHPWEICSGGNSTHISLYVCRNEKGWYLRLEGSSSARVIETIKIAVALFEHNIPFILGKSEEIYRMACGIDYIGIVPETVTPRYCHSFFPAGDKIIDFMNLGTEKANEIIDKAFWYPIPEIDLRK